MADNPFDAFDDSARPATASNPFDALDDDAVVQKRVAENPDLQAVMSRFARSRVDDISATARRVPDPEAFTSLDERTRGKAVQGEMQAAEEVDQRAQAAVRDAQARGDSATYGAAVEAASEAGRRLAQARKLDEDNRAGIVRQASPEQQLALGNAIAAQKKRIDYLNDQIEQADSNPAFLPEGRRIEDVRAELQTEMQALYNLEAGRDYGEQRQAVADPSGLGEFVRGLTRGAFGTVPEMLGGAAKQAGADGVADVLRDFGRGVRRDTAAEAAGEILKLGEKGSFGKDLKNFVSAKFGEGLGTSLPIIAAYMLGGPAGTVTGVSASAALGIGQMRNSLEDAFAEQGVAFPEEHAARYVYLYGTAIGALESLTEVTGMRALTGDAKRQAVRSIGRALAAGAARGAAMEGVTEALQEAVEMYGVTDATGKPLDYAELRRRMTEGFAAGAVPGAAFGAFTGAASNKAAFDIALEKAKELGFGDKPEIGANESEKTADAAPIEPAASPPEATAEQPATADAAPAVVVDPVGAEQAGTAALDVVDSLIPDGTEVDREMAGEAAAVVSDALGLEVADPADEAAAAQQAAVAEAEEQADATTLDAYLAEGGSLSRSALPSLARRMGVTEADLPALLDKAVDAGTLRKTAGGMYRRAAAEPQAAPSEFRQAERQRRAMEAIDEALNFGRQILPKDVTIEVADSLNVGGYELDALSDTKTGHIALAIYANNPKARIGHEGLHTLVTRGHVSPEELAILAETARTSGVWTAKAEAQYRDAYAGRANLDGLIDEEAAAHLVEARIRGQDFGQQANAIIDKIKKVLERIRKALQGRGFKTADDVLDALVSGEMAKREARAEWMRDAQSLFAIRQDQDAMAIDAEARQMMQDRAQEGVELPGGVRVQGVPLFAIRAFHGSPHDFDRFSMDKIGTGEGAQAFGHGLYFAESEGVAREYRKKLSAKTSSEAAAQELAESNGSSWGDMGAYERQSYIDEAQRRGLQASRPVGGRMYEVRINADPEDFLDWDKPLSQQSEKVRGAVGRLGPAASADGRPELFNIVSADGQVIQTHQPAERARKYIEANPDFSISRMAGAGELSIEEIVKRGYGSRSVDPVLMQIKFREAGIPGIRYLDQGSRSAGEGSRNYVVFDDKLIEIVAKDGVPIVRDEGQPLFAVRSDHLADGETYRSMGDGLYVSVRPGDSWGSVIRDGERTAVTVTAAPSRLMQWDATEQTPEVRRALDAVAIERSVDLTGKSGADVVAALDKKLGPDGASGALRDAGIQGSVRGGDYVLYDPSAVQVLAETPEYKRAEDAAVRAYYDDLRENETTYFWDKTEYDDAGDRLPLDDFYPSIYGSGWADIIPAAARAVEDGARALGFDLNLHDSANSNSRYGTIDINGEKKKVRVADHARQSRLHDSADFNISPGGITPFDFLEELVSLSQQGRQKATPQPVDLADYLPQLQEMAARLSDGVDPDDLVTMTPMLQDIASRYGAQIDTDTIARIAADIAGGADVQEVIAREMGGAAPLFAMRSDLDMSPEARKKRAEEMGFDTGTVLYHGTSGTFDEFRVSDRGKMGPGVYLATDAGYAGRYVGNESPSIMPVYVRGKIGTLADHAPYSDMARELTLNVAEWKKTTNELMAGDGFAGYQVQNEIVVFDPRNIRSVNAAFDPAKSDSPNLMYAMRDDRGRSMRDDLDALGFYSAALRAARAWPQTKGTPEQALMWLKKSGVKEGEIEASGLAAAIEGQKSVTRDEMIAHLEKNRVGLKEVGYGHPPERLKLSDELTKLRERLFDIELTYAKENDAIHTGNAETAAIRERMSDIKEELKAYPFSNTKWSSYSLDPGNPSYRETVLHLPGNRKPTGQPLDLSDLEGGAQREWEPEAAPDFRSGHFPEPNITGHMMTSMVRDAEGRPVYLIDQIQSDWGQKLRDGGVRDEAKIAELKRRAAEAEQGYIATPSGANWLARVQQISKAAGLAEPSTYKDAYANLTAILNRRDHMQDTARSIHRASADDPAAADFRRLYAEAATADAATPGHPLVNTTDQWVNTTLRRALMQAAEADADRIAIPSGRTVESYNPQGDSAGNAVFYDQIVPKNLRNLLRKLDKQSPDPVRVDQLETPTQGLKGEGFAVFEITPEVKRRVMEEGQALFGLSDVTRRFMPSRNESLAGINSIVRDLAHDLGITVRQGLTTPAAKTAKRQARKAGTDISSYYDPATGVLRVTSMSDLTAILTHAGEAIIRRYDAAKGRVDERGARDVMNPLERLISRHAFGLLGTYRGKLFGQIEPKYSGMHLAPVLRETLTQYLQAWHNANVATMNRSRDPGGYAKAQRELTNAQRMVARYMGRKLTDAIAMEKASVTSVWGLVQGKVDIAEIRDYVDIRYNKHSNIKPPPPPNPLDRETQRAAFGKWFTTYISDRPAAEAQDPALFEAFEDLIDTTDPVLSAKLDDASDAIAAYAKAEPVQIVTSMISSPKRFGNIAAFFQNIDRDGLLPTLADGARMLYRGGWDDLHPWYTAVRQLLETHRVNTGAKLDLEAAENAYKLLRLGRHSGAWAGRDLEDGIKARASNAPEGPSLVQALQMALGSDRATALDMGQDGRYAQFNAYLIARRAVRLWDRFYDGTLPNPPLNASRETAVATIQKLEGEFPSFVGAADMVYEFQTNLLKLQRDAGIITPETFETLAKEPDYVPFIRDMTDKDEASSRVLRGAQSIIRKIKGSDRNIMDPIATIAQKVYETRQIIATNDAKLALLKLADAAGPGGGAIAERLDPNTSKAMRVNLKDALRNAADELGVSRADANALVELAQELLGDQMTGTVFGKGRLNTTGQNITWVYENGIPVPIKLADGDLGNLMMQTLQTFGNETTNIIVEMMAVPAAITRSTVTAHPSFILRNGFVDGLMAWMYDRQATPWVTQAKGFVAGLMETEKVRAYARSAGLMGGPSTSALDRLRFDRDVRDLVARGYQPKVWESPATFIGELVRHPIRNIALMSEASETGTRARLYELAYDRAIKTGLNPREAAAEAAFYAHDYMDYSRHGSTVAAWSKLVPFMNAALQGMDRYARLLVAKGDYGSAWLPYLNYRLGRTERLDLTEREQAELAQSAQAWMVSTLVMGGISMSVALLWAMRGDDDLQDVPQEIRATHWVIPIDGVYHLVPKELPGIREALKGKLDGEALRLPKGFDNAWFANLVERLMVDARQGNPRWFENYLTDMSSILNPPMEPQALKLFYEMKTGKEFFGNRDIIPKWKQERFPEMMWDEYTSEFAKWAGKKTGAAPYYIDHAMKQLGTSWARDALSLNVPGLPWYDPTKPEKALDDYFIARRFLWKIGKGSEAAGKVREIMGPGDPMQGVAGRLFAPYSRLDAAAETYKEYLKRRDPASGSEFLDRLRPAERAYAILDANVEGDNAKLKMVHPIHRADKLLTEVAGVQKEILGNLFESRKRKKNTGELIPLAPSEKRAAIDILTQYKMMEAHNALVVAGETGYAQRALFDTGSVMDELRAAVPDVADEFEKRLKKAKVIPFQGVREQWPQLRQVLESAEVTALSKGGDKRGVAAKVREFYALAKTAE